MLVLRSCFVFDRQHIGRSQTPLPLCSIVHPITSRVCWLPHDVFRQPVPPQRNLCRRYLLGCFPVPRWCGMCRPRHRHQRHLLVWCLRRHWCWHMCRGWSRMLPAPVPIRWRVLWRALCRDSGTRWGGLLVWRGHQSLFWWRMRGTRYVHAATQQHDAMLWWWWWRWCLWYLWVVVLVLVMLLRHLGHVKLTTVRRVLHVLGVCVCVCVRGVCDCLCVTQWGVGARLIITTTTHRLMGRQTHAWDGIQLRQRCWLRPPSRSPWERQPCVWQANCFSRARRR